MGNENNPFVTAVTIVIDLFPQVAEAVKEIVHREWGTYWYDIDREYEIGGAISAALLDAIGSPDPAEPGETRWEFLMIMNMIFQMHDQELGKWCIARFGPPEAAAKETA